MSASIPLTSGLPPPTWPDATLGAARQALTAPTGGGEWFANASSARSLSVQFDARAHGDVDAWAQALVHHLVEPGESSR